MGNDAKNSNDDFALLESSLTVKLPPELRILLKNARNASSTGESPFRLMVPDEVADTREALDQFGLNMRGSCAFWTDDNSNYAALYLTGPLSGKVCFLSHGEPDLSPVYRSLSSFLEALHLATDKGNDWDNMPTDYPTPTAYYFHENGKVTSAMEVELKSDLELVQTLWRLLVELPSTEDDERCYLCLCIIGLTPPKSLDTILAFLSDKNMWVQARAADILGFRRYLPAIQHLGDLALTGSGNGVTAAIGALGRIGTPEGIEWLLKCVEARATGYAGSLGYALKACGCEATHDRGVWRFRLPGEKDWRALN